ncbi:MAG: YdcF family protein [Oscillospiraceae bacterium]|nr:YdcF family protein [Oscillospiraceae bacterium]
MNQRFIRDVTDFIFINDTPRKCDVIMIPGTSQSVITEKASELFHAGYAKYVLPSGMFSLNVGRFARENIDNPRYDGEYVTDFAYCKHILMENGVPEEAILSEDKATNSMENAYYSAKVLKEHQIEAKSIILCCQSFHARRAYMSYTCYFPNAEIMVVPTNTQGVTAENWHLNEKSYRKVMAELAKCGKYFADCWAK